MFKEGDIIVCYTKYNQIGGMGFQQNYFKVGKRYTVFVEMGFKTPVDDRLVITCEYGWTVSVNSSDIVKDYCCTLSEYRQKKLERILKTKIL